MAICLVTRLKASVNDSNLPVLGGMMCNIAPITNDDGTVTLSLGATESGKLEVELLNSTFEDGVTTKKTIQATAEYLKCKAPEGGILQIAIYNKMYLRRITELYAIPSGLQELNGLPIVEITLNKNAQGLNFSELTTMSLDEVENFTMYSGTPSLSGKVEDLVSALNPAKLKNFIFLAASLPSFDIGVFGKYINLTTLNITAVPATGTVESFVNAQRSAGRTSCSGIAIGSQMGNKVTFNGEVLSTATGAKTLSWTATTITLAGQTINA